MGLPETPFPPNMAAASYVYQIFRNFGLTLRCFAGITETTKGQWLKTSPTDHALIGSQRAFVFLLNAPESKNGDVRKTRVLRTQE